MPNSSLMDIHQMLSEPYALAMAPGFFRVYAHVGLMHALEDNDLLRPMAVCGSSAGAMSAGFYASGLKPSEMIEHILKIDRPAIWDPSFGLGYLQGEKLRNVIDENLKRKTFESCSSAGCLLGMTCFDLFSLTTRAFHKGDIATNMCASACFPVLFQPRMIEGRPYIDAGLSDYCGILSLPELPPSKLILNFLIDVESVPPLKECVPQCFIDQGAKLLSICCNNLPSTHPFNMTSAGKASYEKARQAFSDYISGAKSAHVMKLPGNHWAVFLDCSEAPAEKAPPLKRPKVSANGSKSSTGSDQKIRRRSRSRNSSLRKAR